MIALFVGIECLAFVQVVDMARLDNRMEGG